jgi:hypothetical protein
MTRLEEAAIRVHELLWHNIGHSADWPIRILVDDEIYDKFAEVMDELSDAVEEVRPGSKPWPIQSR